MTAFAEKQSDATAADTPTIYWRWRELAKKTKKEAQKYIPITHFFKIKT